MSHHVGLPDECLPSSLGFPRLSLFLDGEGTVKLTISTASAASVCLFAGPLLLPIPCAVACCRVGHGDLDKGCSLWEASSAPLVQAHGAGKLEAVLLRCKAARATLCCELACSPSCGARLRGRLGRGLNVSMLCMCSSMYAMKGGSSCKPHHYASASACFALKALTR